MAGTSTTTSRSLPTILIYTTLALLLLILISRNPSKPSPSSGSHSHRHRRLKLRSNFTFSKPTFPTSSHHHEPSTPIPFDPLVAEIERRREDRQWEKQQQQQQQQQLHHHDVSKEYGTKSASAVGEEAQPEWEDFMDAEDYLNDQDKFNVTGRLLLLFPKIDVGPVDGFVSEEELTEWNLKQAEKEVMHRSQRELETHDKNKDGFVSFSEYEPPSWVKSSG